MGGQITVCSVAPNPNKQIFQTPKYRHVQFKEHPLRFFLCEEFRKFLLNCPKDTIFHFHSVFIPWFLPAVKLLKRNGFERVVLTPHGQYVDEAMDLSLKKRVFFHFFDRKVLRTVDAVQVIGHTERNRYIQDNAQKVVLIPNGCERYKHLHDVCDRQLVFGYLGRIEVAQKRVDVLLEAFAFYRKQGGIGLLRIAGDGKDKERMLVLCRILNIEPYVEFVGKVFDENKWSFLQECAWFLHPSRWEGLPTACLEAASCGVPLIVSCETNLDTYVEKYAAGMVMRDDGRPVQALADLLFEAERILGDKEEYSSYASHVKGMIAEELNWESIAKMDMELLYGKEESR